MPSGDGSSHDVKRNAVPVAFFAAADRRGGYGDPAVHRSTPLAREATLCAVAAATLAAALAWLGPPGSDLAAHAYQRAVYLQHGFQLWNNFWYAGRYSFVTYSLLYYPLAAVLGIRLLAVATIALAALAFAVVLGREWGPTARWSSRTFAVVWAGIVLSAAFPFALGAALALLALWALQARAHWRFALLAALTLAASPLAFLLLALVVAGIGIARRADGRRLVPPAAALVVGGLLEVILWRVFPDGGRYPYPWADLLATCVFCVLGAALTWRVERARMLPFIFVVYGVACVLAFLVPSGIGENIERMRFLAIPLAVLILSLREWRPRIPALVALGLAISFNATPLAWSVLRDGRDPAADPAYWSPAIGYLHGHLSPSYRVEAVDTAGHWAAVYLPRAGIPLARGWFRQNDFPQNKMLYDRFGSRAYLGWLRGLGVRYVVLTNAAPDYSARSEADLLRTGHSGLQVVFRARHETIFSVPSPRPMVTGPAPARIVALTQARVVVHVDGGGVYRLAIRYSPYWHPSAGCLEEGKDSMIRLSMRNAGTTALSFDVDAGQALSTLAGTKTRTCAGS